MKLKIIHSVGHRGLNKTADVKAAKTKLAQLGYEFFKINGKADRGLIIAIKLFQSIIQGHHIVGGKGVDGRIDPNGFSLEFLNSKKAPKWMLMPLQGPGFFNYELLDTEDNHDYGTSWMAETLQGAGHHYKANYLKKHSNAALIAINDVSLEEGGDTPDHKSHETGISCDLRLPRVDGDWGGIANPNTCLLYTSPSPRDS